MFGKDVVTICPFCKKILSENLGGTHYYNYKDGSRVVKGVRVDSHCGKSFITTDCDMPKIIPDRYIIPDYIKPWVSRVEKEFLSVPVDQIRKTDIDKHTERVISALKSQFGEEAVNKDINDIKMIVQIIDGQLDINVWTMPLTDEVDTKLESSFTVCW